MHRPESYIEIFLHPGEYYWGDQNTRIRTILGSCVTLTTWHPILMVGGITHIMLPERSNTQGADTALNAKYAEDAIALLIRDMQTYDANLTNFQLKLFGGADMFGSQATVNSKGRRSNLGEKNIVAIQKVLKGLKLHIQASHLGGLGHRSLIFDIWSGYVWVKHESLGKKAFK